MAENGSMSVEVVRGEMQPWTDYTEQEPPASGPTLLRLLHDVLPQSGSALIVGPHERAVIDLVAARSSRVTVLLRSVSDAGALVDTAPTGNVTVVAGALDGFDLAEQGTFDVVLAADGLDRVLGADSDDLNWAQRLELLARLSAGASLVIMACWNEASLLNLLDRRPASERHGDDEWRPIYQDPFRPSSPSQLADAWTSTGLTATRVYATFGPSGDPQTLIDIEAATSVTPGTPSASAAVSALEIASVGTPLLASVTDSVDGLIRAGLLGAVAPGWIVVSGARGHALYARLPGSTAVVAADLQGGDRRTWRLDVLPDDRTAGDPSASVTISTAGLPAEVPDTESVEQLLFRLAAAEDVPAFRAVAARLGDWLRAQHAVTAERIVSFDDLFVDGDTFAWGITGLITTTPEPATDLAAAAWYRFQDRLLHAHRRHPWPPWAIGDDLVTIWLGMSGDETAAAAAGRGRELADAVADAAPSGRDAEIDPNEDLRTALADAAAVRAELFELAGHVAGLERTLSHRDRQLKSRAKVIHDQREDLVTIRGYRVYEMLKLARKASRIRSPRALAAAVKRRLFK